MSVETTSHVSKLQSQSTKHVSRACLECRSRHLKCGGQEPVCERCRKHSRTCTYVKSHRGGSRKKGVSLKDKLYNLTTTNSKIKNKDQNNTDNHHVRNHKSEILPCVKNGVDHLADNPNCKESCLNVESFNKIPDCMKDGRGSSNSKKNRINYHPIFNASKDEDPINMIFDDSKLVKSHADAYISPALLKDFDIEGIINQYYTSFHTAHPFLPDKEHIHAYLDSIPFKNDLLLGMKLIGEGQTSSKYARDIETINYLIISITGYIRQLGKDFISLQSLLLLAMISHISSLHDLSNTLRDASISLALELKLNFIDENSVPAMFLDVNGFITERDEHPSLDLETPSDTDSKNNFDSLFNTSRVLGIQRSTLVETMRKTFWELYYFDSISGTASGHTKSRLAVEKCLVLYPQSIPLTTFDYKSRAEACKLVNDAISLNISIQSNSDSLPHLNHMRAALGNWEMKLANPDTYAMPYLINKFGIVNDGLFEAIMLLNYARIFTHRPFSYLWRSDVSKHPRCTDDKGIDDPCPPINKKDSEVLTDSRKIIETRKTIDSANFLMKTLLDSDPAKTCKRSPFLACALAFSCLVHLSAYAWVESNLTVLDSIDETNRQISSDELDTYTEYIKLEIGSILQISKHWSLSAKLITHISETLSKVSPKLYKKVQLGILGLGFNLANASAQPLSAESETTPREDNISPTGISSTINNSLSSRTGQNNSTSTVNTDINNVDNKRKQSSGSNTNGTSKLFTQPVLNYMLLENQQQYPNNTSPQFHNGSQPENQNDFSFPQMSPPTHATTPSTYSTNNSNSMISNNINNNANIDTNNNFMIEFNDLVNSLGQGGNNDENIGTSGVLGFPPAPHDYGFLDPLSPTSDTGCDWVDKHVFQFDAFSLPNT